jgi:hypothetical protein
MFCYPLFTEQKGSQAKIAHFEKKLKKWDAYRKIDSADQGKSGNGDVS